MFTNYKYIINGNKVIAISRFAGKTVKGIAKCADSDTFDAERGKTLAAARCNEKVAKKRLDRARRKYEEAQDIFNAATANLTKMRSYLEDSFVAFNEAALEVDNIAKRY